MTFNLAVAALALLAACGVPLRHSAPALSPLGGARQLVVVTTSGWNATTGTLRRFERDSAGAPWRAVGASAPIVVGRTGLAWGSDAPGAGTADPRKREGDGRAPAGVFPLDTAFGFAPAREMAWVRLPYVQLLAGSECVDDGASRYYNTVVDRGAVSAVDWSSAERMREIPLYRLGVIVGYNAPAPRAGRGSCIFLHLWSGPASTTAGCTAMDEAALAATMRWLDRARRPMLVQLPRAEYDRLRASWGLPQR